MDESLDVQIRHGGTLSNWAVRRIGLHEAMIMPIDLDLETVIAALDFNIINF
jgi:hypothetical protein